MSKTNDDENHVVSVTEKGQATIPKRLREKHGIPAPGRVKFLENEDGEIIVRPVGSMREFRGLDRTRETQRSATTVLRDARDDDQRATDELADRYRGDDEDTE